MQAKLGCLNARFFSASRSAITCASPETIPTPKRWLLWATCSAWENQVRVVHGVGGGPRNPLLVWAPPSAHMHLGAAGEEASPLVGTLGPSHPPSVKVCSAAPGCASRICEWNHPLAHALHAAPCLLRRTCCAVPAVYVKVIEVAAEERGLRVSASMKKVSQLDGKDLDPDLLKFRPRGETGGGGQQHQAMGAAAKVQDAVVGWGHVKADEVQYGDKDRQYEFLWSNEEAEVQEGHRGGREGGPPPTASEAGKVGRRHSHTTRAS
jgi:hypothetical protein